MKVLLIRYRQVYNPFDYGSHTYAGVELETLVWIDSDFNEQDKEMEKLRRGTSSPVHGRQQHLIIDPVFSGNRRTVLQSLPEIPPFQQANPLMFNGSPGLPGISQYVEIMDAQ